MRNIDVFAIKLHNGKSCIHGKFYRNGTNYGNKSFFPLHDENSQREEILESFFYQFYLYKKTPPKILINLNQNYFKEVEKTLNLKNKAKIKIIQPKSGEKLQHILLAEKNALESIKLKNANIESHISALTKLKNLVKINELPNRIEIFDNSHTFGKDPIGVMVVVDKDGFSSKHYRKFNIRFDIKRKNISKFDDYYMMEEVLMRRLKKLKSIHELIYPNIIIIDGGRGQFEIVNKIIKNLNLNKIKLISISKGKDRKAGLEVIHLENKNIRLKTNDALLHFIQRIRDEAHRFAITSHRSKRSKTSFQSVFESLQGIGPKRKKMLLLHFGSVDKIKKATLNELQEVKNIPRVVINEVYEFL